MNERDSFRGFFSLDPFSSLSRDSDSPRVHTPTESRRLTLPVERFIDRSHDGSVT